MIKDTTVRARINHKLKHETENIFEKLGLSMSEAINLFLSQVKLHKGLPFDVTVPNPKTQKAILDAKEGKGVKKYKSIDVFFDEMGETKDAKNKGKK